MGPRITYLGYTPIRCAVGWNGKMSKISVKQKNSIFRIDTIDIIHPAVSGIALPIFALLQCIPFTPKGLYCYILAFRLGFVPSP